MSREAFSVNTLPILPHRQLQKCTCTAYHSKHGGERCGINVCGENWLLNYDVAVLRCTPCPWHMPWCLLKTRTAPICAYVFCGVRNE